MDADRALRLLASHAFDPTLRQLMAQLVRQEQAAGVAAATIRDLLVENNALRVRLGEVEAAASMEPADAAVPKSVLTWESVQPKAKTS